MDWQSLALGASLPPLLWLLSKGISVLMSDPKANREVLCLKVVITGSSRGLGLALADKFLSFGDDVVITSRSEGSCQEVAAQLRSKYPDRRVLSYPCDVQNPVETEALADFAARELGSIDIWVNNAGVSQAEKAKLSDVQPEKIQDIIGTNLLGSMFGSRAAIRVMQKQPSGGKVFMMDGVGATGVATPHSASYGASKRALPQLTLSLAKECKGTGVSVHIVSPGMVMTDLLCTEENLEKRNTVRIFNILAELPQTVSDWMVPRMRGITGTGKYFRFLTAHGVVWRFATMAWRKDRLLKMPPHRIKGE